MSSRRRKKGPKSSTPETKTPGSGNSEMLMLVPRMKDAATGKFMAVNELDQAMGGREGLLKHLEHAPHSAKLEILLNVLADPRRSMLKLDEAVKDAGITAREFMSIFREASVAKAFTEANLALSERLKDVAVDVADKATNHIEPCKCTLGGKQPPEEKCQECKGSGLVYYRGSLPHQQMVFETSGLLKRGGGVNVNVQQQVAVGGGGLFERFVKATDAAAYGQKVIDVEPEDVKEAGSDQN
jgi:hypothetical protein